VVAWTIETGEQVPDDVERILRGLPEWFGIESSLLDYVEEARVLPTVVARAGSDVVGVCLVRRHTELAAEIELLAVERALHHRGVGRALIERARDDARAEGIELLQVKTYGPSGQSVEYARTRAFYRAIGFIPLEERTDIWGPENPCLISVMPI
jgi:GNAT superfamily N-acetyltransferase